MKAIRRPLYTSFILERRKAPPTTAQNQGVAAQRLIPAYYCHGPRLTPH